MTLLGACTCQLSRLPARKAKIVQHDWRLGGPAIPSQLEIGQVVWCQPTVDIEQPALLVVALGQTQIGNFHRTADAAGVARALRI